MKGTHSISFQEPSFMSHLPLLTIYHCLELCPMTFPAIREARKCLYSRWQFSQQYKKENGYWVVNLYLTVFETGKKDTFGDYTLVSSLLAVESYLTSKPLVSSFIK